MLGIFLKAFSQGRLPLGKVKSSEAMCNGGRALWLGLTGGGPSAVVRTYLGSCRLEICTVGKLPLGNIYWEVVAWEKACGKVPNINNCYIFCPICDLWYGIVLYVCIGVLLLHQF